MTVQPNTELHSYQFDSDPVRKQIYYVKQGTWALKSFLYRLGRLARILAWKKDKGTTKHQDREWPELERTRRDLSLATPRLPTRTCSREPREPAGRRTSEPGRADTAKEAANVSAHGTWAVTGAPTQAPPTTTGVSASAVGFMPKKLPGPKAFLIWAMILQTLTSSKIGGLSVVSPRSPSLSSVKLRPQSASP